MSTKSAGLAGKMGYKNIGVMLKGNPGWKKSGGILHASKKLVETGNIVLVDLRSAKEVQKGHIPRAVNIPFNELEDAEDDFPSNKSAPLVFYGNGDDAVKADKMARKWGYKKTSIVPGGYAKWEKDGDKIAKGPAGDELKWVRKLEKGEVSIAEFEKAIGGKAKQVILDVRTNDEIGGGKFAGSIHIPLDELEARMGELPKDKELLIHCTTGARAEMAWQAVEKAGLKARFCVANVECEGGKCEIEE
jgi:rhodanese-related sulfurtransferase